MKTRIRNAFTTIIAAVGFATAAWATAPTPVAVWDGDFATLTKQGWTVAANGNTLADGALTIVTGANGVLVTNATAKGTPSIIVRYANLARPDAAAKGYALVTLAKSLTDVDQDYLGIASHGTAGKADGLFQNKYWHTSASIQVEKEVPTSGVFGFAYTRTSKTDFYVRGVDGTTVFSSNGMKSSGDGAATFYGFAVGGMRNQATTINSNVTYGPAEGLVITGIAVFEETITADDVEAYRFPSEAAIKTWGNVGTAAEGGVMPTGSTLDRATIQSMTVNFGVTNYISQRGIQPNGKVKITKVRMAARPDSASGDGYEPKGLVLAQGTLSATATDFVQVANGMPLYKPDGSVFATRAAYEFTFAGDVAFDTSKDITLTFKNSEGANFSAGCTLLKNLVNPTMKWSASFSPLVEISGAYVPHKMLSINIAQYWNGDNGSTSSGVSAVGQVTTDQTTLLGTIPAAAWAQSSAENIPTVSGKGRTSTFAAPKYTVGTAVVDNPTSTQVLAYFAAGTNLNRYDGFANTFRYAFLTAKNTNEGSGNITVTSVPFEYYDAIFYMSSTSADTMNPISVNGTLLYPTAEEGVNTTATSATEPKWGNGQTADFTYGQNVMRVNNLSGDLTVLHTAAKWGIAAVQLVSCGTGATIPANANIAWADIAWESGEPEAGRIAVLTLEGDATVTVNAAAVCGTLVVKGTGTLTLDAGDNLTCTKITSAIPLVLTTAKNQAVDVGANDLVYNYTGAAMAETVPSVTCTGNITFGGTSELKWTATIPEGKTFTVADTCKVDYYGNAAQSIKGTVVIKAGATFANTRDNDVLWYDGAATVKVYGTLDMGNTRWTAKSKDSIITYPGGQVIGAGHATYKAIDYCGSDSGNIMKFDLGDAASGMATVTAGIRDRDAGPVFDIPENMTVAFGSAFTAENKGNHTFTKKGAGVLKILDTLNVQSRNATDIQAGILDLTAMTGKSTATQIPGSLTVADAVAIRFPAGFTEDDTFTLCGGTLTASAKVRKATVYIGDAETSVEDATLIYDAENKTVAYTTKAPGSITISGNANVAAIIAAVATQEGEEYADDVMVTMDAGATLTVEQTFTYPKMTIVSTGAIVIDYQLDESETFAKIDLSNVSGDWTITTALNLPIDAGARNLTYNYTGAEPITNENLTVGGTFTKGGSGAMFVNFGSSRTAATVVNAGKLGYAASKAFGNDPRITVGSGAVLDFNGCPNNQGAPAITLNGGTLQNGVNNGGGTGQMQIKSLTLTADSTIDTPYEFGMVGGQYAATTIALDTYTLTKKGAGAFNVANAGITGTGKIRVEAGAVNFHNKDSAFSDGTFELAGGTLSRNAAFTAKSVTVVADSAITGSGNLTAPITISGDATLDCTAIALPIAGASLPATQEGRIMITLPSALTKIATATAMVNGLALVDANNTVLDSCTYDSFFWYGQSGDTYALTDDDKTAIAALSVGPIFTKQTLKPALAIVSGTPAGYFGWAEDATVYVAKKSESISIKFGPRAANNGTIAAADASIGGYPVAGKFWNHSKIYNNNNTGTTEIFELKDGNGAEMPGVLCYYYTPNTYANGSAQTTGNGKLTKSYFDDTDRTTPESWPYSVGTYEGREYFLPPTPTTGNIVTNLRWEVAITNIPYQVFDLYLYQASDQTGSSIKLLPLAVKANDGEWKYFAGDDAGSTVAATYDTIWNGAAYCNDATMVEGTHYIRYRISKAALGLGDDEEISVVYLSHPKKHGSARLGLAGLQIVLVENDGYYTRKADAGADWLAENSWLNSSQKDTSWANPSGKDVAYATIDGDDVSTIDISGEIRANEVKLVSAEDVTFTFTRSNEGMLTAPIDATGFHGKIVPCEGMTSAITLGSDAHIEVTIPADETVALADILPSGITVDPASAVTIKGAGTLICDGAFPTAYTASLQDTDNWTGTVWLKNVHLSGSVMKNYGNANSKIKVTGVTGWMNNGDQQVAELVLEDDGDTFAYENDDSSLNYAYTYAKFTGNGTFKFATKADSNAGIAIADVSDFTGALLSVAGTNRTASLPTTARPIYVGTATVTAGKTSLISVADGATINAGCGWQAASAAFGATLTVKGSVDDVIVSGLTTAPELDTTVTLKDRETGEIAAGTYALAYADGAVKVAIPVTFALPTVEGAPTVTVTGGKLVDGTVTAFVDYPLTVTYTAKEGLLFANGTNTKTVEIETVITGDAAREAIEMAVEGDTPVAGKAKIGTTYYLTFAAAVEAANAMESATVEPLVDATVKADMTVNATVAFKIGEDITLTLEKGGFKASQFVNNGTIYVVGGSEAEPITLTGDGNFGAMMLGENTYVKNDDGGTVRKYLVSGSGATSVYMIARNGTGAPGMATDSIFHNVIVASAATGTDNLWLEHATLDETVGLRATGNICLNDLTPNPFVARSLTGAGKLSVSGNQGLTIACIDENADYSGASSVPITISSYGGEVQTFSGNYTGALTIEAGATAKIATNAAPSSIVNSGTLEIAYDGEYKLVSDNDGVIKLYDGDLIVMEGISEGTVIMSGTSTVIYGYTPTINDLGKFAIPEGKSADNVRLYRADGTQIAVTKVEGGFLYYDWEVTGKNCWWDYEFDGTVASVGTDTTTMTQEGTEPFYNTENTALWVGHATHYRGADFPYEFTAVLQGKIVNTAKQAEIGFGSTTGGSEVSVAIVCGENVANEEVKLIISEAFEVKKTVTMNVPNAYTADHLYAFVYKTVDEGDGEKSKIIVYLDGTEWDSYTFDSKVKLGDGFQIGSVHGGIPGGYSKATTDNENSFLNFLRVYKTVLSDEAMAAYAKKYPYQSTNGNASRTFAGGATAWVADDAWTVTPSEGEAFASNMPPASALITIDAAAAATVTMNLDEAATYEQFKVLSGEAITLKAGGTVKPTVSGLTTVGADLTVDWNAIGIGKVMVPAGVTLTFDCRDFPITNYFATTVVELTGNKSGDGTVAAVMPSGDDYRTVSFGLNEYGHYALTITVTPQPFIFTIAQGEETGVWTWGDQEVSAETVASMTSGTIVKRGDGTALLTAQAGMTYAVDAGTLMFADSLQKAMAITVNANGTFDLNGHHGNELALTLNGGKLTNSGAAITEANQVKTITLMADSTIDVPNAYELYAASYNTQTTIALGDHTLTKTGGAQMKIVNTRVTGSGTFYVKEGSIFCGESTVFDAESTLKIGANGTWSQRNGSRKTTVTTIVGEGGTLDVQGQISGFNLEGALTIANNGSYGTITNAAYAVATIGSKRGLTFAGAGTVNVTLSTSEFNAGAATLFNRAEGATVAVGVILYNGADIADKCTVSGNAITAIDREAKIGSTFYLTFLEAMNAAQADQTVTLLKAVTITTPFEIKAGVTLDLNRMALTPAGGFVNHGVIKVYDIATATAIKDMEGTMLAGDDIEKMEGEAVVMAYPAGTTVAISKETIESPGHTNIVPTINVTVPDTKKVVWSSGVGSYQKMLVAGNVDFAGDLAGGWNAQLTTTLSVNGTVTLNSDVNLGDWSSATLSGVLNMNDHQFVLKSATATLTTATQLMIGTDVTTDVTNYEVVEEMGTSAYIYTLQEKKGTVVPADQGTSEVDEETGNIVITPKENVTALTFNVPVGFEGQYEIPSTITNVTATAGSIAIENLVIKSGGHDIAPACKITASGNIVLDGTKSVTIDEKTIPVTPTIATSVTVGGEEVKPFDGDGTVGVMAIPGLTYQLVGGSEVASENAASDPIVAGDDCAVKLVNTKLEKGTKMFFRVKVTK